MANSEQEDILDGLVHIYECDEQHVSALIIPTDGEIREDLPVYIEDAESDTIYATTTTDTYGMINTTFSLSPGTHTPTIKCGSNKHNIYDTSVVCHACSLTLTSDKDILSATDGDIATLTATLIGTESGYNGPLSGREVAFEIYQASDDTFIETLTATTNSSGVATVSYSSQGIGDISIVAKVGSLCLETYAIEDCRFYDATEYSESNNIENSKHGTYDWISSFSLEVDFKASATNGARFMITDSSVSSITDNRYILTSAGFGNNVKMGQIYTTTNSVVTGSTGSANTYMHFKFEKYSDNTVKVYVDDVLLNTGTLRTYSENTFDTRTVSYNGRKTLYWKNLKIKPL